MLVPPAATACQLCAGAAATEVVRILLDRDPPRPVPHYSQFDPYLRRYFKGRLRGGNRHPWQRLKRRMVRKMLVAAEESSQARQQTPTVPGASSTVTPEVVDYVVRLIQATHPDADSASEPVKKYVRYGASPRGAQSLILGAKVRALMDGRVSVDFDDVRHMILPALRHRIILNFEGESTGQSTDTILSSVIEHVPDVKK